MDGGQLRVQVGSGSWEVMEVDEGQVKGFAMTEHGILWMAWHGMEGGAENQCCLQGERRG